MKSIAYGYRRNRTQADQNFIQSPDDPAVFRKKYGKISAGTSIQEKGRGKSSLAPSRYLTADELFKNRDSYNINSADVIKSYYAIRENVDKYIIGRTFWNLPNVLSEGVPAQRIFHLLADF